MKEKIGTLMIMTPFAFLLIWFVAICISVYGYAGLLIPAAPVILGVWFVVAIKLMESKS